MFKKALAILVGMIVIAASLMGAFGVVAEDAAIDDSVAGTKEEGITEKSDAGLNSIYVEGLNNGDFEEGFKWWGGKQAGGASTVMELKKDGENTYVQYKADYEGTWKGIRTPAILIPEDKIAVGDQLVVIYDAIPGKLGDSTHGTCVLFQLNSKLTNGSIDNNYRLGNGTYGYLVGAHDGWGVYRTQTTNKVIERQPGTDAGFASSGYYAFALQIESQYQGSTLAVDNFRLAKLKDGKYYDLITDKEITLTYDTTPVLNGTEEEGITIGTGASYSVSYIASNMYNGDFESGLLGWASTVNVKDSTDWFPTNIVEIKTESNGNKYIQFDGDNAADSSNGDSNYVGIRTDEFSISDDLIDDGDQLALVFKYKDGDGNNLQWVLEQGSVSDGKNRKAQSYKDDIKQDGDWYVGYASLNPVSVRSAGTNPGQASSGSYVFYIQLECAGAANAFTEISLDDVQICKLSADGNKFYDVYTGKLLYDITPASSGGATGGSTTTGTGNGTGAGTGNGTSATTGDSVLLLVALLFVSGAGVVAAKRFAKAR